MTTETYNRTRKAFKLADVLDHVLTVAELPPEDWHAHVESLDDAGWERIATLANTNPPGPQCLGAVLAIIDERCSDESPFAGLTGDGAPR